MTDPSPAAPYRLGTRRGLEACASLRGTYAVLALGPLLGGFVAALADGHPLGEAVRRGCAAAEANALHPGQAMVDPADLIRILPAITMERIDA
jgi:hypothetical protein